MLYIGTGDGGSGGDPTGNAQNLELAARQDPAHRPAPVGARCRTRSRPTTRSPAASGCRDLGLRAAQPVALLVRPADRRPADRRRRPGRAARRSTTRSPPDAGRGVNFGWDCREGLQRRSSTPAPVAATGPPGSSTRSTTTTTSGGRLRDRRRLRRPRREPRRPLRPLPVQRQLRGTIRSLRARAAARPPGMRSEGLSVSGPVELRRGRLRARLRRLARQRRGLALRRATPRRRCARRGRRRRRRRAAAASRRPGSPPPDGSVSGSPGDDVIVADGRKQPDQVGRRRRPDLRPRRPRPHPRRAAATTGSAAGTARTPASAAAARTAPAPADAGWWT